MSLTRAAQLSACGRASLVHVAPLPAGSILDEVDGAVRELSDSALHNRVRFADVRRAAVRRFKFYGVYDTVRENEVWVLAIFHGRRHPRVLQERLEGVG